MKQAPRKCWTSSGRTPDSPERGYTTSYSPTRHYWCATSFCPTHELTPECLQIYTSGDSIVILDARTLALARVLAFWEAFPGLKHGGDEICSLAVDSGMKIVRTKPVGLRFMLTCTSRLLPQWGLGSLVGRSPGDRRRFGGSIRLSCSPRIQQ